MDYDIKYEAERLIARMYFNDLDLKIWAHVVLKKKYRSPSLVALTNEGKPSMENAQRLFLQRVKEIRLIVAHKKEWYSSTMPYLYPSTMLYFPCIVLYAL